MAEGSELSPWGSSRFIAFIDECGDHSMSSIDQDFPLFLLSTVIVEREKYVREVIPYVSALKLKYWDHEGINLHSRDIRKSAGPFQFLTNRETRELFMMELQKLMQDLKFTLFISAIRKDLHLARYGARAGNPYELAMTFTFERVLAFLREHGETRLPIVAEGRGKREDAELERAFWQLLGKGTRYHSSEEFRALDCPLIFKSKQENIVGVQLADLCGYPAARYVLNPTRPNRPYEAIRDHIYTGEVKGWKIFPH